jgi:NAD(P)-dependent dehydrogenase (short-subunit alcohol dehydrogenase family)
MFDPILTIPDPSLSIDGKVAIVTGGAAGIGRATAEVLAARGAAVVIGDINGDSAERVAAALRDGGARATGVAADMGDERQIESLVQTAMDVYGRLDVLHNNAALTAGETLATKPGPANPADEPDRSPSWRPWTS